MTRLPITAAVIVAAGRGQRAGGDVPKQWQEIAGQRVLDHTLAAFLHHPRVGPVVLVLDRNALDAAPSGVVSVAGGMTRAASVCAGLEALDSGGTDYVLIHDVARPCVSDQVIDAVIDALATNAGAAPALPVSDALWTGSKGQVTGTQDRAGLFRAQTPQGFRFPAILDAHRAQHGADAADDVAIARAAGLDVAIVAGDEDNLKITYPDDFARAERILENRNGYQARERI